MTVKRPRAEGPKVFWFFFSKKNGLPLLGFACLTLCRAAHAGYERDL
jgi:hypothetical protein